MVPRSTIHKWKREFFRSCFCIIMSSPAHSDLSQNDAEMLEEQQSLLRLQKAAEAHRAAQKARREVEARAKEEAKR